MFRVAILFISLIWASLVLISWGGATEPQDMPQTALSAPAKS